MKKYSFTLLFFVGLAGVAAAQSGGGILSEPVQVQAEKPNKPGYSALFKKVSPAVVSLYALRLEREPFPLALFGFGPLDRFDSPTRQRISQSIGSGSIVTPEGLVVTNSHVIHGAQEIKAVTYDRREFELELVLEEPEYDLAVLRIKAPKGATFSYLEIENSDLAETGDVVLAIGNPFGLSHTLTQGIISAVGRTHQIGVNPSQTYIQADAVINPGNSGGPLISPEGKLLGTCTFIISRTGGSEGIGFAIPSNMIKPLLKAAQEGGKEVMRPWLGLEGQTMTAAVAESIGLSQPGGIMITKVYAGSPAHKAGLQVGDAIVKMEDELLVGEGALSARVMASHIGSVLKLDVLTKNNENKKISVTLTAPPAIEATATFRVKAEGPLKGAVLAEFSPAVEARLKIYGGGHGVVIMEVAPESTARSFGLKPGDVLESIQGQRVKDVKHAKQLLSQPSRTWKLTVKRGSQTIALSFAH